MRKHGWQLPYHPLQVVAVAVFLALGFAFYVFFAPFVGKKLFQYIVMGIYTPLIVCVFGLYIWCAAADPADSGVFKSKKYLKIPDNKKHVRLKESKLGGDSTTSINDANAAAIGDNPIDRSPKGAELQEENHKNTSDRERSCFLSALALLPCALVFNCCEQHDHSSELQMSEEGMFYCSLCEVEVFRYSKHCRVCDKCVDRFDHHCRWLNNCIGKRNYRKFFALMISALILLTLQWATGISVLICCFIERKRFSTNVASKLGSSFSVVPYVIVVAVCTILAMIATLPLSQLFFFHILLIKKGISTYDYIIAMREQEQQGGGTGGGQQSPQMSQASSLTGLSSASSFNAFNRGAWCTPPRLFLEDQFDVIPPETGSVSSLGKKSVLEEPTKKKNPAAVKISPWAVARMNAETVAKYAAEARSKSKIYQPVSRREGPYRPELDVASSGRRMIPRPEIPSKRRSSKRIRLPSDLSPLEPAPIMAIPGASTSTGLGPLRPEARIAFRSQASSSPDSSLGSPDQHVFRVSSSGTEEASRLAGLSGSQKGNMPLSRSTSDGYDASGGEDSDRVSSSRIIQRPVNWSNLLFGYDHEDRLKASSSSTSMRRI